MLNLQGGDLIFERYIVSLFTLFAAEKMGWICRNENSRMRTGSLDQEVARPSDREV